MDAENKLSDDAASSDGEDDYESADEGESAKEKSSGPNKGATVSSGNTKDHTQLQKHANAGKNVDDSANKKSEDLSVVDLLEVRDFSSAAGSSGKVDPEPGQQIMGLENTESPNNIDGETSTTNADKFAQKQTDEDEENPSENTFMLPNIDTPESSAMEPIEMPDSDKGAVTTTTSDQNENTNEGVNGGWGSWGSWGAVLNQATASVTSGLSHVIESVETTLGIPDPGELEETNFREEKHEVVTTEPTSVKMNRTEEDAASDESQVPQSKDDKSEQFCDTDSFLSSWGLSSISQAVTSKGLELVTEGIDALETIGKRTIHVISEGDPGLRNTRNIFQKPTLSQTLREAKELAAKETAEQIKQEVLEMVNFNDEFDRYQGLAHLEALEILSKESEGKIESMLTDMFEGDLEQAKLSLLSIESVFTNDSASVDENKGSQAGEFAVEVGNCAMALNLAFVPDKLNKTEEVVSKWLAECVKEQEVEPGSRTTEDIYSHVITSLANITAKSMEVFRRVAEMIFLEEEEKETVSAEDRSVYLYKLTRIVMNRISSLSTIYAQCLNMAGGDSADSDNITPVITEVYLESSNSSSHVQDAFKLLLPVLQVSALNNLKRHSN